MKSIILNEFKKHLAVSSKTMEAISGLIEIAANICINSLKNGNKILLIGISTIKEKTPIDMIAIKKLLVSAANIIAIETSSADKGA